MAKADKSSDALPTEQNLSRVKIRQNRPINKTTMNRWQSFVVKPRQACNLTVISLLERQKLSFAAKLGDRLYNLKKNCDWNPSATMLSGLMNRSGADGICWLSAYARDVSKICCDKTFLLILSGQF